MKAITTILLISFLNGSPIQTVQADSTVVVSAEVKKKKNNWLSFVDDVVNNADDKVNS